MSKRTLTFGEYMIDVEKIPYYTMLTRDESESANDRYVEYCQKNSFLHENQPCVEYKDGVCDYLSEFAECEERKSHICCLDCKRRESCSHPCDLWQK